MKQVLQILILNIYIPVIILCSFIELQCLNESLQNECQNSSFVRNFAMQSMYLSTEIQILSSVHQHQRVTIRNKSYILILRIFIFRQFIKSHGFVNLWFPFKLNVLCLDIETIASQSHIIMEVMYLRVVTDDDSGPKTQIQSIFSIGLDERKIVLNIRH